MNLNFEIYVDKTGLIEVTNSLLNTQKRYMCLSRPRRFGKSMAADMLAAYYSRGCDSDGQFKGLEIGRAASYRKHLNHYDVIKINMQSFMGAAASVDEMPGLMQRRVLFELKAAYPDFVRDEHFIFALQDIFAHTGTPFIILIDEWDCIFREYQYDKEAQKKYLDFLRAWLKDQECIALAYMTGILPIKKYGSHSALNMFTEYSMTNPGQLTRYFGFTENEVNELCRMYDRSFDETKGWYDGYELTGSENGNPCRYFMYSPKSVVDAMNTGLFDNYWNQTETFEALKVYIQMNFDGLKDAVITMLAGGRVQINTGTFSNDMTTFATRDDVLTLLIHLGYLSYSWADKTVSIPNKEVSQEYVSAIKVMDWPEVTRSIEDSFKLFEALWRMDADTVAEGIDRAHEEISILKYNDENSLSCTIQLAFYCAREYYTFIREMPTGRGFADICLIPRKTHPDKPAAVIELKWDESAKGAISQIHERRCVSALEDYHGNLILAGINYDRAGKKHSCVIEKLEKS